MKTTYILRCNTSFGKTIVKFDAYTILDARIAAEEWMKRNHIYHGWLTARSGKEIYISLQKGLKMLISDLIIAIAFTVGLAAILFLNEEKIANWAQSTQRKER